MLELGNVRSTAEAIGRITSIKTGEEIGLLYRWDNGETQAALYNSGSNKTYDSSDFHVKSDLGEKRS